MTAEVQIELFTALFYVCLAIAIIGLGLAVLFFFIFDIPSVYALITGKAKRQTVERMAVQNSKTGRLQQAPTSGNIRSTGPVVQNPAPATAYEQTAQLDTAADTSILSEQAAETSVLSSQAGETSVLSAQAGETSVLSRNNQSGAAERKVNAASGIRFEITEDTLVIHTAEII